MSLHEFNLTSHGVVTGNSLVVIASAKLKWKILWDCHLNHSTSTSTVQVCDFSKVYRISQLVHILIC